jgi:predicted anti-sigma-YlaC factor YlaD
MPGSVARGLLLLSLCTLSPGCVKELATDTLADSLAASGSTFASDDDPQLVRDAAPFSLKLTESVLAETPKHRGLLLAAASEFTQYAYGFILQDADRLETHDIGAASELRDRARKLLLRARDYGLRGLDVAHSGFSTSLRNNPQQAVQVASKSDVPLLYWTAAAWGSAITISKNDPELIADRVVVESMIDRALVLDETFEHGAIHSFLISYEPARQGATESAESRCRKHFNRAVELSEGLSVGPYVALAEAVSIQNQNKAEFESLLNKALAIDVNAHPQWRLENMILQSRARWLLERKGELFLE